MNGERYLGKRRKEVNRRGFPAVPILRPYLNLQVPIAEETLHQQKSLNNSSLSLRRHTTHKAAHKTLAIQL